MQKMCLEEKAPGGGENIYLYKGLVKILFLLIMETMNKMKIYV